MIKNRFKTTMLADGGPPLFFSLMKPASYYELKKKDNIFFFFRLVQKKKKDVGGIMTGVSVRKVLTMFVQSSSILLFLNLRRGRIAF